MRIRQFFRKFHRWIGLIASLWLLVLATTGFILQHSHQWKLDQKFISNAIVLKSYGIGKQFIAFKQGDQQLIQLDNQLVQNNKATIKLSENINSALYHNENWIVATNTQILWLDDYGKILQSMDELDEINLPVDMLGQSNQHLVYSSQGNIYTLDTGLIITDDNSIIQWPQSLIDENLKQKVIAITSKNYLSYEQVIFDIHAGLSAPSIFNDIAAISLIILSLSGIFLFIRKRKRNRQ